MVCWYMMVRCWLLFDGCCLVLGVLLFVVCALVADIVVVWGSFNVVGYYFVFDVCGCWLMLVAV